jgi:hypothetical protein
MSNGVKPEVDVWSLRDLYAVLEAYAIYNDRCWIFDAFEAFDPRVAEMHMENIALLIIGFPGEISELLHILYSYANYARQIYGGMYQGKLVGVIKAEVVDAINWYTDYLRGKGYEEDLIKEELDNLVEQRNKLFELLDCGLPCGDELSSFSSILALKPVNIEARDKTGRKCWQWWQLPKPDHSIIPWKNVNIEELVKKLQKEAAQR